MDDENKEGVQKYQQNYACLHLVKKLHNMFYPGQRPKNVKKKVKEILKLKTLPSLPQTTAFL